MVVDKFDRYVEEDAERWMAVHMRIQGLMVVIMAIGDILANMDPRFVPALIDRLQIVLEQARRDQAHPAEIEEIERVMRAFSDVHPTKPSNRANGRKKGDH